MHRVVIVITFCFLNASGILLAQKAADPGQRYFRVIALVHLTGSGGAGDPVVPEYVVQGTAVAQAGLAAAAANQSGTTAAVRPVARPMTAGALGASGSQGPAPAPGPMSSRPGILGWSMIKSDDGTMAIVQMVAADHHAFDSILADTRPEIMVFEVGKTPAATIQSAMQKYRQDFNGKNLVD